MTETVVNDKMQQNYRYVRTEQPGRNFNSEFKPGLTPRKMLELGAFGGKYMTDCCDEFPVSWFTRPKLSPDGKDIRLNYYNLHAGLPLSQWFERGWIHPDDPRGCFQWYCRYYSGLRMLEEDLRQIQRWKGIKRHVSAIQKNCSRGDFNCRRKQRQAILHWAYDARLL